MHIQKNLYYLRKQKGLQQSEMQNHTGFTRTTWSNYENGNSEPNIAGLLTIANFFGVTLDQLICHDLEKEGNLIENSADRQESNLTSNPLSNVNAQNEPLKMFSVPGKLTSKSSFEDVVKAVNELREDIDRVRFQGNNKKK